MANGDLGASMGECTDVASAKRAVRGVLTSDEVESSVFRLSIVTVRPFLLLVDILKLSSVHVVEKCALMRGACQDRAAKMCMEGRRL